MTMLLLAFLGCAAVTALLTPLAIVYAREKGLIDQPDSARRSHDNPIPRGGGVSMVVILIAAFATAVVFDWIEWKLGAGLIIGLLLIGSIGWIDDHRPLSARLRITVHFAASIAFVLINPISSQSNLAGLLESSFFVVAIVWMTNLFNFMDGTDGLASAQAGLWGLALCVVATVSGQNEIAVIAACACGGAAGFLMYNKPPARVFMGDVGSGSLGFLIGAVSVFTFQYETIDWSVLFMLIVVFVLDATATLLMRMWRGEQWYNAHREHAYQLLVRSGYSHSLVLKIYVGLNLILVWPIAILVQNRFLHPVLGLTLVGSVLLAAWWQVQRRFSPGNRD